MRARVCVFERERGRESVCVCCACQFEWSREREAENAHARKVILVHARGCAPLRERETERERAIGGERERFSPPFPNTVGVNIKHTYCFPSLYVFFAAGFNGNRVSLWSV